MGNRPMGQARSARKRKLGVIVRVNVLVYAAFFDRDDLGRDGTFAPERRALERPMAIACLRFLCSPFFRWRISVATAFEAFGPYLRPELFLLEEPLREDEDEDLLREVDFLALAAIWILPCFP
jgi:hypothetical protein